MLAIITIEGTSVVSLLHTEFYTQRLPLHIALT